MIDTKERQMRPLNGFYSVIDYTVPPSGSVTSVAEALNDAVQRLPLPEADKPSPLLDRGATTPRRQGLARTAIGD